MSKTYGWDEIKEVTESLAGEYQKPGAPPQEILYKGLLVNLSKQWLS